MPFLTRLPKSMQRLKIVQFTAFNTLPNPKELAFGAIFARLEY